jgi:hypothetical protein
MGATSVNVTFALGGVSSPGTYSTAIHFTLDAQTITRNVTLVVRGSCADAFASAVAISGANGTVYGTNATATGESGEPNHAGASVPLNSVWCNWTAPTSGSVTFDTTGSDFDTTLAVYTGTNLANLTLVASNNDISAGDHSSRATFNATQGVTYRIAVDGAGSATGNYLLNWAQAAAGATTFAAVLPYARSILGGDTATAFATIINGGNSTATACAPAQPPGFPATFTYQTTNAANQLTGTPNTPVNIAAQAAQSFVFGLTPVTTFSAAEIGVLFDCSNTPVTVSVIGLNTFILSVSLAPSPDIVAIGATPTNDGIANIPGNTGTGFFAAAGVNIGSTASITASADDGGHGLPVTLTICQTNPGTGQCLSPPAASTTTTFNSNSTLTYTVFVQGNGNIPFDPANNRLFLRFKDASGVTRGATNVAVRTQ